MFLMRQQTNLRKLLSNVRKIIDSNPADHVNKNTTPAYLNG